MRGRPRCIELPKGRIAKVLADHIHGELSMRLPYSCLKMRSRARWGELYKNRSCLQDVLTSTGGFQLKSTYATEEMQLAVDAAEMEGSDVEKAAYRLRVMMSHLRDAKKKQLGTTKKIRCSSRAHHNGAGRKCSGA